MCSSDLKVGIGITQVVTVLITAHKVMKSTGWVMKKFRFRMTRYIFVTGGVVSSLGKGIASASLAAILEARGLKVTMLKLDPYINVDPGTMSPFQHGEVFVTEDLPFKHICHFTDHSKRYFMFTALSI